MFENLSKSASIMERSYKDSTLRKFYPTHASAKSLRAGWLSGKRAGTVRPAQRDS